MSESGRHSGDEKLLIALARGTSVAYAAGKSGLSERTVYRRLREPDFQQRLQSLRNEMLTVATGTLTATMQQAAQTLRDLLQAESPSVRLTAARSILDLGPKLAQTVLLEERIAELEWRSTQAADDARDPWGYPLRLTQQ